MMLVPAFASIALAAFFAGTAVAQTATPQPGSPGPIVGGRDIQPHPSVVPPGSSDPEAAELLHDTHDEGPVVPPHDLYGKPLGLDAHALASDTPKHTPAQATPVQAAPH